MIDFSVPSLVVTRWVTLPSRNRVQTAPNSSASLQIGCLSCFSSAFGITRLKQSLQPIKTSRFFLLRISLTSLASGSGREKYSAWTALRILRTLESGPQSGLSSFLRSSRHFPFIPKCRRLEGK